MHSNTVTTAFLSTTSHESLNAQSNNPFDPANLRLSQDFTEMAGVKTLLTTVPVRKPKKHDWFRVHPLPEYRQGPIGFITYGEDREQYIVAPAMARAVQNDPALQDHFAPHVIYTCITRQGTVFLWAVRLPQVDSKGKLQNNDYWASAHEHAQAAMKSWVRITANKDVGAYDIFQATAPIPDPVWPEHTMADLLGIAFKGKLIDRPDHEILKLLYGQA
jgi:hypothetical protein